MFSPVILVRVSKTVLELRSVDRIIIFFIPNLFSRQFLYRKNRLCFHINIVGGSILFFSLQVPKLTQYLNLMQLSNIKIGSSASIFSVLPNKTGVSFDIFTRLKNAKLLILQYMQLNKEYSMPNFPNIRDFYVFVWYLIGKVQDLEFIFREIVGDYLYWQILDWTGGNPANHRDIIQLYEV